MNTILKKCKKYKRSGLPTIAKRAGLYPYFNTITSEQGPIVTMDGKDIIMLGSNNYLGMTGHPDVKSKAIQAIEEKFAPENKHEKSHFSCDSRDDGCAFLDTPVCRG